MCRVVSLTILKDLSRNIVRTDSFVPSVPLLRQSLHEMKEYHQDKE